MRKVEITSVFAWGRKSVKGIEGEDQEVTPFCYEDNKSIGAGLFLHDKGEIISYSIPAKNNRIIS